MQLQLSDKEIKELATNSKVYTEGREYWEQDVVRDRHYDAATETYEARIYSPSGSSYDIMLGITRDGRLRRASCTCKAYRSFWGFCKHIVATLVDAKHIEISEERIVADRPETREQPSAPPTAAPSPSQTPTQQPTPERSTTASERMDERFEASERQATRRRATILDQKREQVRLRRDSQVLIQRLQAAEARSEARLIEADSSDESRVRLQVSITLPAGNRRYSLLKLKIGQERLYVVKNIEELIEAAQSGQELNFGKQFTFVPVRQRLTTDDQQFLDWLSNFYYSHAQGTGDNNRGNPYFRQNSVHLPLTRLTELLSWAAGRQETFSLWQTGANGRDEQLLPVHRAMPPIRFFLTPTDDHMSEHLDLDIRSADTKLWQAGSSFLTVTVDSSDEDDSIKPLRLRHIEDSQAQDDASVEYLDIISGDGSMVYFQDAVWIFPAAYAHLTSDLLLTLEAQDSQAIYIERNELQELLNLIYRPFTDHMLLRTSERFDAEHEIMNETLTIDIWLDREGRDVTLAANFVYGDLNIDPHPEATGQAAGEDADRTLIIRDRKEENDFYNMIQGYGFRPAPPVRRKRKSTQAFSLFSMQELDSSADNTAEEASPAAPAGEQPPKRYYLHGDERILNFISQGLPHLQETWNLFATTRFLNMRPGSVPKFGASLRLSPDQSFLDLEIAGLSDSFSSEDLQDVLAAYREKKRYVRVRSGVFYDLQDADTDNLDLLAQLNEWGGEWSEHGMQLNRYRSLAISAWLQAAAEDGKQPAIQLSEGFVQLAADLQNPDSIPFSLPDGIGTELRPYQERGVRWLETLSRYQLGGILADEMGLGKTLQALVYILAHKDEPNPALIIAPTSLVYNWEREAQLFTPDLRVQVITGSPTKRQEQLDRVADCDLVITSYTLARQDLDRLIEQEFSSCFLDEAQFIKNPRTQTSRAIKKIKARNRFALSGTPLENNLTELWSLFDFLMPGYLFNIREFQEQYATPILNDRDQTAADNLRFLIAPFILRRLKKDVLTELPDKITTTYHCDMTEEQSKIYAAQLERARSQVQAMGSWEDRRSGEARLQILSLLTRLRQVACHPSLFLHDYHGGSGKMETLGELLDQLVNSGHRVLIFSQFTSMLALIREQQEALGRQIFYIDGSISSLARLEQVDRFNSGEGQLFLISLRAGGTGLNLATADTVIHVDPWWNPAVENQATDRAHRIGQTEVVQVIRLITGGSIEEKIQELQARKQDLLDEVVQPGETFLNQLSVDDLRVLFS